METPEQPAAISPGDVATGAQPAPELTGLRALRTWVRDLLFATVVAFLIIVFLYEPVKVEGWSMEPGLEDQERIFINKLVYRFERIERGDIVVFHYPRDERKSFIKRVIALPGDRIVIRSGQVYVNDKPIAEPYVGPDYRDARSFSEIVVPENSYFVLGDHRNSSNDSREIGAIPRRYIYGKAVFGYWPMEKLGVLH